MATLKNLEKQIEELKKRADLIRKTEMAAAINTVRALISQFGLTARDVGLGGARGRGKAKAVGKPKTTGVPKYHDPQSGKTWTGHGKPPNWIAGAADRTKFLIDGQSGVEAAAASKVVKARAAKTPKATAAVKPAAPTKKTPEVKKPVRTAKAVAKPATPSKKSGPARKARQIATKKAVQATVQEQATEAAAPSELA